MSDEEIVEWLNSRTGSRLKTLKEAQSGREVCYYLCEAADSAESQSQVTDGTNFEERKINYTLVKQLFDLLHIPFRYDIQKLAKMDKSEFVRLVTDLMALDDDDVVQETGGETSAFEGDELEALLADLEANLAQKMKDVTQFQEEMAEYATERDFYLSKLLKIEKVCADYPAEDADSVFKILGVSSNDFLPVDKSK